MMTYMCEGGGIMWLLLLIAIVTPAVAFLSKSSERARIFLTGCILEITFGMFGMALGMRGVFAAYARHPDKADAIAAGLAELSNNGTFATALALVLGAAALIARRRVAAATDAPASATVALRDVRAS